MNLYAAARHRGIRFLPISVWPQFGFCSITEVKQIILNFYTIKGRSSLNSDFSTFSFWSYMALNLLKKITAYFNWKCLPFLFFFKQAIIISKDFKGGHFVRKKDNCHIPLGIHSSCPTTFYHREMLVHFTPLH